MVAQEQQAVISFVDVVLQCNLTNWSYILALVCCQNPEFVQPLSWEWRCLYFRWWISVKVDTHQSRRGPSFRPRALIQICTPGGGRRGRWSIRAAFHRCSQQHPGEVMAHSSWPGSSALLVWWTDGGQPISYGLTCPRPPKSLWSLEEAWPWLRSLAGLVAVIICCTCRGIWHWRDENFFENWDGWIKSVWPVVVSFRRPEDCFSSTA